MGRTINFAVAVMLVALAAGVTGCGPMYITMNPSVLAVDQVKKNIPGKVTLFMDHEFRNYHWEGFSKTELRGLDYALGSASKNLFLETFKRAADGVALVETMPAPEPVNSDIVLVVRPRIGGFSEDHNMFIRNANYYAEITYHVTIYDKTGKIVLEKDYFAREAEMGNIDVYRNHAAPAEKAMAQAVLKIMDDISRLAILK